MSDASTPRPSASPTLVRVVCGVVRRGNTVFVARRAAHKSNPSVWEFPGGKIEPGEDPASALRREWLEEFCVPIEVGRHLATTRATTRAGEIELVAFWATMERIPLAATDHDRFEFCRADALATLEMTAPDRLIARLLCEAPSDYAAVSPPPDEPVASPAPEIRRDEPHPSGGSDD
ncbi:MAG: NUDIX domain-containing protein [Myxococcales bacterium]|nr:NUDIX domain-containing protein [Myxococcales bacterium]